jgi:DNA (cytosine-5)-methyltransferase 1
VTPEKFGLAFRFSYGARVRGIDIFSGSGGMSIGAAWAGVQTVLAVESDPNAAKTYSFNHPEAKIICADIRTVDFTQYKSTEESVLFGGTPCQGFSTSNQRTRNSKNKNNWLFKEFLRAAKELQTDWVVFENVKGIAETENAKFLEYVIAGLKKQGYSVKSAVLNARDFGVPQTRSRQFVVAARHTKDFKFPNPSTKKPITVRDAISDLPKLKNGASIDHLKYRATPLSSYAKQMRKRRKLVTGNLVTENSVNVLVRYKHIPEGGNWESIPDHLMGNYKDTSRCHTGIYKRLAWDQPSITIGNFRKNMLVHPRENRGLSVREAARLQSFPDNFRFFGSIGFQQQQVGNAVPPLLAKVVFQNVVAASVGSRNNSVGTE